MEQKIKEHFKKTDPILYAALNSIPKLVPRRPRPPNVYFQDLVESIISQQLSGKAGTTIFERFKKVCGEITPKNVLSVKSEDIRACGISNAKVSYIKDLAQKTLNKELETKKLESMGDEEVISELTKIKGIGRWTAEMFLLFTLAREDVFSYGDLGLRNAIKKLYGIEDPSREEVEKLCARWSPYKTWACRILWRSLDSK